MAHKVRLAFALKSGIVDQMILVRADDIPADMALQVRYCLNVMSDRTWCELFTPNLREGGCKYGCKVCVRRNRAGNVEYAVRHSSTYGHPRLRA